MPTLPHERPVLALTLTPTRTPRPCCPSHPHAHPGWTLPAVGGPTGAGAGLMSGVAPLIAFRRSGHTHPVIFLQPTFPEQFPWFVYQTIGGAVATGTHGSSIKWGSLSGPAQLLGLEVVTADGAVKRFTPANSPFLFKERRSSSGGGEGVCGGGAPADMPADAYPQKPARRHPPDTRPHLCTPPPQALRVSLGRLGVITRVHLRIVREGPVRRALTRLAPSGFLALMRELQAAARGAGANLSGPAATAAALPAWADNSEWFWIPQACVDKAWGDGCVVGATRKPACLPRPWTPESNPPLHSAPSPSHPAPLPPKQKHEFLMVSFAPTATNASAPPTRPAGSVPAANASAAAARFAPDATTVFASKGALLALGELELPADAVVNFTAGQLEGAQPLVDFAPQASHQAKAVSGAPRLYQRGAAAAARVLDGRVNAPLPAPNASGPRPADPAEGEAWDAPTPNRPSGGCLGSVWRWWGGGGRPTHGGLIPLTLPLPRPACTQPPPLPHLRLSRSPHQPSTRPPTWPRAPMRSAGWGCTPSQATPGWRRPRPTSSRCVWGGDGGAGAKGAAWQASGRACADCMLRCLLRCASTFAALSPAPSQPPAPLQPETTLPQLRRTLYDQYEVGRGGGGVGVGCWGWSGGGQGGQGAAAAGWGN
jgi:hypothetical protein